MTYVANRTARSITGVGFQPDWVWIKNRGNTESHALFDAVRGVTKRIASNSTGAEETNANTVTPGRYAVTSPDATELPTRYASNDNTHSNIIDNPNSGGLKNGRPFAP